MAGEVYFNVDGVALNADDDRIFIEAEPWFISSTPLLRYYPLDSLTDMGPGGYTLENSGVTFDDGYANFDSQSYLQTDQIPFAPDLSLSGFTIFYWFKPYDLTTPQVMYNFLRPTSTNTTWYTYFDGSGNLVLIDRPVFFPTNLDRYKYTGQFNGEENNWYHICYTYREDIIDRLFYSGDTQNTYLLQNLTTYTHHNDAPGDNYYLTLGKQYGAVPTFNGQMSGFILEYKYWTQSEIEAQIAKGPYPGWNVT